MQALAVGNCTVSANPVAFGAYNPNSATPVDSVGNVQVSCTLAGMVSVFVSYQILLSTGFSPSFSPRTIINGAYTLSYNLYINAGRSMIWGDGTGGSSTISDSYLLGLQTVIRNYPVYGRISAAQNVPAGNYSDTITVTVNY